MRTRSLLLLALLSAAACTPDRDVPEPRRVARSRTEAAPDTSSTARVVAARRAARRAAAGRPAPVVFDTTEPPEVVRTIPPRPDPPPSPPPPDPPAPSAPPGPSGSCDVRPSDGYCFAYTGTGWTPESAGAHCEAAPDATFRAGPCPTADRIATCTYRRPSEPDRELVYTTYAPADLDLARLACPGVFETVE